MTALKAEEVRLVPFETTPVPEGWKIVSDRKSKKLPEVSPHNWYGRPETVKHFIFHQFATTVNGLTIDEIKAMVQEDEYPAVEEVFKLLKRGASFAGWDLISPENDESRYRAIWRDPRTHYAVEQGLGDQSNARVVPDPRYYTSFNKKPEASAPKEPKAPKAPRAKSSSTKQEAAVNTPEGGYLKAYEAAGVREPLEEVVNNLVDASVNFIEVIEKVETPFNVRQRLMEIVDKYGLEASNFVDFVARHQKEGAIKAGFYKQCKDFAKRYSEYLKSLETVPVQ
jgi:hypothetical protein